MTDGTGNAEMVRLIDEAMVQVVAAMAPVVAATQALWEAGRNGLDFNSTERTVVEMLDEASRWVGRGPSDKSGGAVGTLINVRSFLELDDKLIRDFTRESSTP